MKRLSTKLVPLRQLRARPATAEMADKINDLALKGMANDVKGQADYYNLRNFWGRVLAIILGSSIFFQFWLAYMVGKGNLNFQNYTFFLNIVASENFLQVVGLCYIVVKFLFPNHKQKQQA